MNDLTIWLTYHNDKQIQEFGLKETDTIRLFKSNDVSIAGDNINHLNRFYSELTTMYYVWKNRMEDAFYHPIKALGMVNKGMFLYFVQS